MRAKKSFIILLFIIGSILILISTFNFIYKIPSIDETLEEKGRDFDFRRQQCSVYGNTINSIGIMENQLQLLYESNPNSVSLLKIEQDITREHLTVLTSSSLCVGESATGSKIEKWNSMNLAERKLELKKILEKYKDSENPVAGISIMEEIQSLKDKKRSNLFWSSILQVLGLLINQMAIILDIHRRD
jgi:hypothetical protein